jgi:hypothetical protein
MDRYPAKYFQTGTRVNEYTAKYCQPPIATDKDGYPAEYCQLPIRTSGV